MLRPSRRWAPAMALAVPVMVPAARVMGSDTPATAEAAMVPVAPATESATPVTVEVAPVTAAVSRAMVTARQDTVGALAVPGRTFEEQVPVTVSAASGGVMAGVPMASAKALTIRVPAPVRTLSARPAEQLSLVEL